MVIEVFCPDFNFQATLGFATTMWLLALTRVYSNDAKDYRIIPSIPRTSDCSWILQADQSQRQSFTITMTAKYNETFFSKSDIAFKPSSLYRVIWNHTQVVKSSSHTDFHMQLLPTRGDPFYIRQTKDTLFLLLRDNVTTDESYVYIIGFYDNTDINVHSGKVPNDYSSSFNSELLDTMQINSFEQVLLNSSNVEDGVFINSSQPIGVFVTSSAMYACNETDVTWEMIPPTSQMGTSFNIYVPQSHVFLCNFLSLSDGNMTVHYKTSSSNSYLEQLIPKTLNLTDASLVYITTSVPIQTLCTTWVHADDSKEYINQFFLLPMEQYSNCSSMVVESCNGSSQPCAIAMGLESEKLQITSAVDTRLLTAKKFQYGNITFSIWEIYNLTDGLYFMKLEDNRPFIVYRYDLSNGRFFPLEPYSDFICENVSLSNMINVNSSSITDLPSSGQTASVTSLINTSDAKAVYVTESSSLAQTTSKTEDDSENMTVTTSNGLNDTDKNVTSTVKSLGNVVASNIAFLYEELPEDDKMLNEYMIAVIVSLCTAIFAVIAVISTFLLLEVLARRKQLRNSKIRPMVS